jgi:tRNA(fMet)-specific endonuclease VapC
MKPVFMLDTNAASCFIRKNNDTFTKHMTSVKPQIVCISAITEGELRFGISLKPEATRLSLLVEDFLAEIQVLDWTRMDAEAYGPMRAGLQKAGIGFGMLDALIAAHALSSGCTLVTADKAFSMVPNLKTINWEV